MGKGGLTMKMDDTKYKDKKKEPEMKSELEWLIDDAMKREREEDDMLEEDSESDETDSKPPSPTTSEPTTEGQPLEIGDFLTPLRGLTVPPTVETFACDLTVGQVILHHGQPVEIIKREHTRSSTGPLSSRHTVRLEVVALFDKERVEPLVLKGKDKTDKVVGVRRRRWCFLGLFGDKRDVLVLRKQERDPAKRDKVGFRLPAGGKIGEDIKSFFALAEGEEERYVMPVTVLLLEGLGRYQIIGLGVGDWKALG